MKKVEAMAGKSLRDAIFSKPMNAARLEVPAMKVDVAAWVFASLAHAGLILGCPPEVALSKFLNESPWLEAAANVLNEWVLKLDDRGAK